MKHIVALLAITILSNVVALPLSPADPLTHLIWSTAILVVAIIAYLIGLRNGQGTIAD